MIRKTETDLYYNFNYSSFALLQPGCLLPEETMTEQQDSGLFWDFDRGRPGVFTSSCLLQDQKIAEAWRIQLIEESLRVFGLLSLYAMNRAYVLSETYKAVIEQLYTVPKPYRTRYQAVHLLLCGHTQLSGGQVTGCSSGMLKENGRFIISWDRILTGCRPLPGQTSVHLPCKA